MGTGAEGHYEVVYVQISRKADGQQVAGEALVASAKVVYDGPHPGRGEAGGDRPPIRSPVLTSRRITTMAAAVARACPSGVPTSRNSPAASRRSRNTPRARAGRRVTARLRVPATSAAPVITRVMAG